MITSNIYPSICFPGFFFRSIQVELTCAIEILTSHILFFSFLLFNFLMAAGVNNLLDPSLCSCFPGSYQYTICNKIKWSTLSIGTALLIIVRKSSRSIYKYFVLYIDCLSKQWIICLDRCNNYDIDKII